MTTSKVLRALRALGVGVATTAGIVVLIFVSTVGLRHYPEVVMGLWLVFLALCIALVAYYDV